MTTTGAPFRNRLGVIDLGSNSILLLVVEPDGRVIEDDSRITRLGQGVFRSGRLDPSARARTRETVAAFAQRARALGAGCVVGVGTEALRRALDGAEFLDALRREGLLDAAHLLSGEQEAECAIEASRRAATRPEVIAIDVGGGSTEVAWTRAANAKRVRSVSLPLGSVRLTEAYVTRHPVPAQELASLEAHLAQATAPLAKLRAEGLDAGDAGAVAVAGTATTLAAMDLGLAVYDPLRVEGHRVALDRLGHWIERLAALDVEARRRIPGLEPGRADVIVAGLAVLRAVMRAIGAREIRTSGRGVRHGVALRLLEDPRFLG
jgi:exopolyphosphatase/guanosine-5'-triphosphate,3'-diphosphate pyrophosphatase